MPIRALPINVMQDVRGLIDLYGGDQAFIAKLDALWAVNPIRSGPVPRQIARHRD